MNNRDVSDAFRQLSTPLVADACLRLGMVLRLAPTGIRPVSARSRVAGRVLPARHYGSVDIFLEAMRAAGQGDVLVIDNGGRTDEACIGDLVVLEARGCGLAGVVVWGCHRDSAELVQIGFPTFTYGACPAGPRRLDAREPEALEAARFGHFAVGREDLVFADADGALFVAAANAEEILAESQAIQETERRQAKAIEGGTRLAEQLQFEVYLAKQAADPSYTFRRHLRALGGAIEE